LFSADLLKITIINFYENLPGGNRVVLFVRTAIQYTMECTVLFRSLVIAPKNQHSSANSTYDCANLAADRYVFSLLDFRANQIGMHAPKLARVHANLIGILS
jgi:hypothetical protein